jgi:hypothetical protein
MRDDGRFWVILGLIGAAGAGAWFVLRKPAAPPPPPAAVAPAPPAPAALPPPDAGPSVKHPIEAAADDRDPRITTAEEADAYLERFFTDLLGRKSVRSFLNVDGVVRRFVVTVDNLASPVATAELWPVKPTPGRFVVETQAGASVIAAGNDERYAPVVRLLTGIDTQRAARVYTRLYPLFQQAYEELGYPGRYFNDRLIEVIDHLLAAPTPEGPVPVRQLSTDRRQGASSVVVFEDAALERATAGHKILVRMGAGNAARVKAKLGELRGQLARRGGAGR